MLSHCMIKLYNLQGIFDIQIVILNTYMVPLGNYMDPWFYVQNFHWTNSKFSEKIPIMSILLIKRNGSYYLSSCLV